MHRLITGLLMVSAASLFAQTPSAPPRVGVVVQSISITSDSSISTDNLERIKSKLHFLGYPPDAARFIAKVVKEYLEDEGYFQAEASTSETETVSETAGRRYITAILRIRQGEQYRVSRISFARNKAFSEAQLRQTLPIHDGDLMSNAKVREGLEKLRQLYATKGYMEVTPVPEVAADDANHTLSITMNVDEGPQFTVLGITLEGDREWPPDKAGRLQTIAGTYQGTHAVGPFIDAVKQTFAEIFPGCDADQFVGVTQGGQIPHSTANVRWPENCQSN